MNVQRASPPAALVCCLCLALFPGASPLRAQFPIEEWHPLAPLPDKEGVAGAFAGIWNGALWVAGGANFPDKKPWEGGAKLWHDSIFALDKPSGTWRRIGKLPQPVAYGVSVTLPQGLVWMGGSDATQHFDSTRLMRWVNDRAIVENLAPLPRPMANGCGAIVGGTIYVAGGSTSPDATNALQTFWRLDFSARPPAWRELEAWPGPGRILATAGSLDGSFYLFGGAALKAGLDGQPAREWLRDAYRYKPGAGWKRIADLPRCSVGAPSPAPMAHGNLHGSLLILGGDDGEQANKEPSNHIGFRRDVLAYDPKENLWRQAGQLPFSLVTTPVVTWQRRLVIPGGETRPGMRSSQVFWSATLR